MKYPGNLILESAHLAPGHEWVDQGPGWHFLLIGAGEGYWLSPHGNRNVSAGEIIVTSIACFGALRASTLNTVDLYSFSFCPDRMLGFFTLAERSELEKNLHDRTSQARFVPSTHPLATRYAILTKTMPAGGGMQNRAELLSIAAGVLMIAPLLPPDPRKLAISARARFEQLILALSDVEFVTYTPGELAAWCDCSTRYFSKLFRDYFGASVREYRSRLRRLRSRLFSCQLPPGSHREGALRAVPENRNNTVT